VATIHHLPHQTTPFIGRAEEITEIAALLADPTCRLLTLVGPGGIGKTRLALEAAQFQAVMFPDGIEFVALQALSSPDFMIAAIADALRIQFYPGGEPKDQLLNYLHQKTMLLVVDNFEHLLEGVALLSEILDVAPGVKMLVTSRERLNLREEWVFGVGGLSFPAYETEIDIEAHSAVRLFLQNAQRTSVGFQLTNTNKLGVARICQIVGGMPLALELAAAWVRALSCEEIADEINRNVDILESSARNVPPRHRNMRAVLESSWVMLSNDERDAFKKLSVFRGGCSRRTADALTQTSPRILSSLVDKSMLRLNAVGRYEIHELLRQYGEEQLDVLPDEGQQVRDQHCAYFLRALYQLEPDLRGQRQLEALNDIQGDFENVRAAWQWAVHQKNADAITQSMHSLYLFCEARSRFQEGWELFWQAEQQFASEGTDIPSLVWGRIRARRVCLQVQGYLDATGNTQAAIEDSLSIAQNQDNRFEIAFCIWTLGETALTIRDFATAIAQYETSLNRWLAMSDRFYTERTLQRIGFSYGNIGQLGKSAQFLQKGLEQAQAVGDKIGLANCLYNLGSVAGLAGNFDQYYNSYLEALELRREIGDQANIALNTGGLGVAEFTRGNIERAKLLAEDTLAIALEMNHMDSKGLALIVLGLVACVTEAYARGKQLGEECRLTASLPVRIVWAHQVLSVASCGLGEYAAARGYFEVIVKHLTVCRFPYLIKTSLPIAALIRAQEGEPEQAVEWLALAFTSLPNMSGWMEQWPLLTRWRTELEAKLSPRIYRAAWDRGTKLTLELVLADLIQIFSIPSEAKIAAAILQINQLLIEPLSERELEVLHAIAAGLSNAEIAVQLVVEVSTVKKHINHLYDKLGVETRTQVLVRARELNLL
jgi:predicted ATPase/DNA-binding CsgD family transcriptional regulator